jgi:hypothetical protein
MLNIDKVPMEEIDDELQGIMGAVDESLGGVRMDASVCANT